MPLLLYGGGSVPPLVAPTLLSEGVISGTRTLTWRVGPSSLVDRLKVWSWPEDDFGAAALILDVAIAPSGVEDALDIGTFPGEQRYYWAAAVTALGDPGPYATADYVTAGSLARAHSAGFGRGFS